MTEDARMVEDERRLLAALERVGAADADDPLVAELGALRRRLGGLDPGEAWGQAVPPLDVETALRRLEGRHRRRWERTRQGLHLAASAAAFLMFVALSGPSVLRLRVERPGATQAPAPASPLRVVFWTSTLELVRR